MRILLPSFTHVYRHGFDANPDLDRDRHQNGNSDTNSERHRCHCFKLYVSQGQNLAPDTHETF